LCTAIWHVSMRVCAGFWKGIGRGSPGVVFISTSKHCSRVSPGHLHCFTQRQHVPFAVRVTILLYTNSTFETGEQPAKSDIQETDVFSLNPWNFVHALLKTGTVGFWGEQV
jgi:hypothetical protein